jgi:NADH dehydrogenase [ubiquinone] 1 alpha subcomplex assembly factor 1
MALAVIVLAAPPSGICGPPAAERGETTVTGSEVISITEFDPAEAGQWRAVDDVVMGGVSASRIRLTEAGIGVFEGEVSLANNGGFASVRRPVGPLDLSGHRGIALRVRGDGQRYRLRLRTDDRYDGIAWQAGFVAAAGTWRVVHLAFDEFEPTFRGRRPSGAGPLDVAGIRQLGLMIAERQAGPFRLEIDWIRALPEEGSDGPLPPAATRISPD